MQRSASAFVFLCLSMVALAGCLGGGDGATIKEPSLSAPEQASEAQFDENTGAITGQLVDEEGLPIVGAEILIRPTEEITQSAQDGTFTFSFLDPDRYILFITKFGFELATRQVTVVVGEVAPVEAALVAIPPPAKPRVDAWGPYTGFIQCRMSTFFSSGACGFLPVIGNTPITDIWDDTNSMQFELSGNDYTNIVFEARWTGSTAATDPNMMQVFSYEGRTSTHWFADSGGVPNPIKFTYVAGEEGPGGQLPGGSTPDEPNDNLTLLTWLTVPFGSLDQPVGFAYEMHFELFVTAFYNRNAPESYTALGSA